MRGHHRIEGQRAIGVQVFLYGFEAPVIDRKLDMRVGNDVAVPRKMLAARSHAAITQPLGQCARKRNHCFRKAMECPVAYHPGRSVVEVEDGCE